MDNEKDPQLSKEGNEASNAPGLSLSLFEQWLRWGSMPCKNCGTQTDTLEAFTCNKVAHCWKCRTTITYEEWIEYRDRNAT